MDIYLGVDTGSNTTFGPNGDDNGSIAGIVGFGLNMMDGNLTVLALSHLGPENPTRALSPVGIQRRSAICDTITTSSSFGRQNDKLTLTTEATWVRDDFGASGFTGHPAPANGFGIAQYAGYALTDTVTLNARAELFRDDNGFFVAGFPGNYDPVYTRKRHWRAAQHHVRHTSDDLWRAYSGRDLQARGAAAYHQPRDPAGNSLRSVIGRQSGFNRTVNATTGAATFKDSGAFTIGTDVILTF